MTTRYSFLLLLILCAGLTCGLPEVSAQNGSRGSNEAGAAAGDGETNPVGGVSALAGKWVSGEAVKTIWTYTGSYASADGWHYAYRFSPDGAVEHTGIMNARTGDCSERVFTFQKGRASLGGDTLTIKWARGTLTRDVFCVRVTNHKETISGKTQTLKVRFKTSSTGQKQFCTVSSGGETCFTRAE